MNLESPQAVELITSIQERCGAQQTGVLDMKTLLAIDETLAVAHRLFVAKYVDTAGKAQCKTTQSEAASPCAEDPSH